MYLLFFPGENTTTDNNSYLLYETMKLYINFKSIFRFETTRDANGARED